jgi:predicted DNA-binding transcriptional regulator AlpA
MRRKTKRKKLLTSTAGPIPRDSILRSPQIRTSNLEDLIPGPKLRAKLGISAVTLWRWRHDEACDFPAPKVINGRLYFPLAAVSDWLARQREAA